MHAFISVCVCVRFCVLCVFIYGSVCVCYTNERKNLMPVGRAGSLQWFDEYNNDGNHMLRPSHSPHFNPAQHLWHILN